MDASNALLEAEVGRTGDGTFEAMVDSGDHKRFNITAKPIWSGYSTAASSYKPKILADGIVSGENMLTPDSDAVNDTIDFAAFSVNLQGAKYAVAAGDLVLTPPVTLANKISAVCVYLSTGVATVVEVEGTEGAAASATRGAAGGPPFIPVGYVQIGQYTYDATGAQVLVAAQIQQVAGTHTELATYPEIKLVNPIGKGLKSTAPVEENAFVEFASAMDLRHTGGVPKAVYAAVYEPVMSELVNANSFKGAFLSVSGSSEQVYRNALTSKTISLSDGSYERKLRDGVTDTELKENTRTLTFRFYPDGDEDPHQIVQGAIGVDPSYDAASLIAVSVTIVSEVETALFAS